MNATQRERERERERTKTHKRRREQEGRRRGRACARGYGRSGHVRGRAALRFTSCRWICSHWHGNLISSLLIIYLPFCCSCSSVFYFLIFFFLVRLACFREYTPFTTTSALRFREVDEIMFGIWIRFEV
jgi:hypothetical protein